MAFALPPGNGTRACVGGGAGFIGSHIARRLKEAGYYVVSTRAHISGFPIVSCASRPNTTKPAPYPHFKICVDWVKNEFMENDEFCSEFILGDLRKVRLHPGTP